MKRRFSFVAIGLVLGLTIQTSAPRSGIINRGAQGFELPPYPPAAAFLAIEGTIEATLVAHKRRIREVIIDSESLSEPRVPDKFRSSPEFTKTALELGRRAIQSELVEFYRGSGRKVESFEGRQPVVFEYRLDSELPVNTVEYRVSYGAAINRVVISACSPHHTGCVDFPKR